jgi:hypothetical protein
VRSGPTVGPDKDEDHLKREIPIGGYYPHQKLLDYAPVEPQASSLETSSYVAHM